MAQSCYFIDPGTNFAETAFMVHPDWQGSGLGGALQQRMAEHARQRGVLGFVAEIMASNEPMIRLAQKAAGNSGSNGHGNSGGSGGSGSVHVDNTGSTVRVTILF